MYGLWAPFHTIQSLLVHENAAMVKKNDQKILWHYQMIFISFIGVQTFKVKLFTENSLWNSTLNHLQTKVAPRTPIPAFFSVYIILKKLQFEKLNFFIFRFPDGQKSFNAVCNNILLHFCTAIMDFFLFKLFL